MPRKVDRGRRRQRVLRRAGDLFARRGFEGVTMRQVARALGCSTGALYHFFPSKEALFRDCLRQAAQEQISQARDVIAKHDDAREQLMALARHFLWGGRAYQRLLLLRLVSARSQSRKLRSRPVSEVRDGQIEWLSEIFKRGYAEGALATPDPVAAARLFVAMVDGLVLQWHAGSKPPDAKATDEAVSFLLRAFERRTK